MIPTPNLHNEDNIPVFNSCIQFLKFGAPIEVLQTADCGTSAYQISRNLIRNIVPSHHPGNDKMC